MFVPSVCQAWHFSTHALAARLPACLLQQLQLKGFCCAAIVAGEGSYKWFAQRDFSRGGAAPQSELLPAWRQAELQAEAADAAALAPGAAVCQTHC